MLSAIAARRLRSSTGDAQKPPHTNEVITPTSGSASTQHLPRTNTLPVPTPAAPKRKRQAKGSTNGVKEISSAEFQASEPANTLVSPSATVEANQTDASPPRKRKARRAYSPSQPVPSIALSEDSEGDDTDESDEGDILDLSLRSNDFAEAPPAHRTPQHLPLSTFRPTEGVNFFPSSDAGSGTILILRDLETLCFSGLVTLTVMFGGCEILGTEIDAPSAPHRVFAPRSFPLPTLQLSRPGQGGVHGTAKEVAAIRMLPLNVKAKCRLGDLVVKLEPLRATGVEGLGDVVGTFAGNFGSEDLSEPVEVAWGLEGFYPVYRASQHIHPFALPPAWREALKSIAPSISSMSSSVTAQPLVAVVKGPKRSGKSNFARTLLNRLTAKYRYVAYLDCDLGQSEFSPGGMVTLHILCKPAFGPPFAQIRPAFAAHFIGSTTPRSCPSRYVSAIAALIQTYRLDLQYAASELSPSPHMSEDQDDKRISHLTPLVVNTQGWTKGLGSDIMHVIEEMVQPTHILELQPSLVDRESDPLYGRRGSERVTLREIPGLAAWADDALASLVSIGSRPEPRLYTLPPAPAPVSQQLAQANDQRPITLMSYFHARFSDDELTVWTTQHSLLTTVPYEVELNAAFDAIVLSGSGSEEVVPQEAWRVLNGALVALVETDAPGSVLLPPSERLHPHDDLVEGMPYVRGSPPPDPSVSKCLGLAFVRAVSTTSGPPKLHLITPVPPKDLARCRVLVKGDMEMPIWAFIGSSSSSWEWKGNGGPIGGTVLGVSWESVPHLAFRNSGAIEKVVGSEVKRGRKNVMRRRQM